jgi:hypothetical protein
VEFRYRPTVSSYRGIADDPGRAAALDDAITDLVRPNDQGTETSVLGSEYLLRTARWPPGVGALDEGALRVRARRQPEQTQRAGAVWRPPSPR